MSGDLFIKIADEVLAKRQKLRQECKNPDNLEIILSVEGRHALFTSKEYAKKYDARTETSILGFKFKIHASQEELYKIIEK